jgi:hypothetical protein
VRPPTEELARKCDGVFPELRGWFASFYDSSRTWMPPGFRDWSELEDAAAELSAWTAGIVSGIAQTSGYARGMLAMYPGATTEQVEGRLRARMARQRRLFREDGPVVHLLVDMAALYRAVVSAEVMAGQCGRLAELAVRSRVTIQVVPPVGVPLATASVMIADSAGYTENALTGAVYSDGESVRRLRRLFDSVRSEARPASESLAVIREAQRAWTGVSRATAATAVPTASRRPRARA